MVIKKGGKVAEKDLVTVIELLMNELVKLAGIVAEGDVKLQRKMQVCKINKKSSKLSQCFLGYYSCNIASSMYFLCFRRRECRIMSKHSML